VWCGVAARRRGAAAAAAAAAMAAVVVVIAFGTFALVPVGTLGLTAHQMRWVWSVGAFVTLALVVGAVRGRVASTPRMQRAVAAVTVGVVGVLAVLDLPAHVQPDGPAAAADAQRPARDLSRQLDEYAPGPGGVVFETGNLRFSEPYSTVVMSALQRNGIDFFVEDHGLVRQLGEARRFDGTAAARLYILEDRPALDVQPGATRIALSSPLDGAQVAALVAGEQRLVEWIKANGLALTPEGAATVGSGALGVTLAEVDAAASDAQRLVAIGAVARLTRAGVLDIAAEDRELFEQTAELRAQVDLRTVAVFAEPAE
jgi:hypothetical protein